MKFQTARRQGTLQDANYRARYQKFIVLLAHNFHSKNTNIDHQLKKFTTHQTKPCRNTPEAATTTVVSYSCATVELFSCVTEIWRHDCYAKRGKTLELRVVDERN